MAISLTTFIRHLDNAHARLVSMGVDIDGTPPAVEQEQDGFTGYWRGGDDARRLQILETVRSQLPWHYADDASASDPVRLTVPVVTAAGNPGYVVITGPSRVGRRSRYADVTSPVGHYRDGDEVAFPDGVGRAALAYGVAVAHAYRRGGIDLRRHTDAIMLAAGYLTTPFDVIDPVTGLVTATYRDLPRGVLADYLMERDIIDTE